MILKLSENKLAWPEIIVYIPNMNQETLCAAINQAEKELAESRSIPSENWQEKYQYGGIPYGTRKEVHFPLESYKGKPTKKYGHVVIERLSQGTYETVVYIL